MQTEGIEVRSVGNTLTLHETALTEAFNLKAAIEYQLKNSKLPYKPIGSDDAHKINIFQWKQRGKLLQICHLDLNMNSML